ncbi:MAG: hypothetical protein E6J91_08525 [Deltaproteobacteria bacterium]|nr:MAG: hypothetical protein E6J91_08525 [Deltaproteobacteria bacterium]
MQAQARQLIERLDRKLGIKLHEIIDDDQLSPRDRRRRVVGQIFEAALARVQPEAGAATVGAAPPGSAGDDVEVEPNIAFAAENARYFASLRGKEMHEFVFSLTKRFENMVSATGPAELAYQVVGAGIVGLTIEGGINTLAGLRNRLPLLKAVEAGIRKIGMRGALLAAAAALGTLIVFFLSGNQKAIFAMIFNDTDEDMIVRNWQEALDGGQGDVYLKHGSVVAFPQDWRIRDGGHTKVQLYRRLRDGTKTIVYAGLLFGQKNVGPLGVEGLTLFTLGQDKGWVSHLFAVPYARNNGTNIEYLRQRPASLKELYEPLYQTRQVAVDRVQDGVRVMSAVDGARGGLVTLMAIIST